MLRYRVLPVRKHTRIQSPMNQPRFGRQTEKLDDIAGQFSFFNEAEANYNGTAPEPAMEEVIESAKRDPVSLKRRDRGKKT